MQGAEAGSKGAMHVMQRVTQDLALDGHVEHGRGKGDGKNESHHRKGIAHQVNCGEGAPSYGKQ